MSGGFNRRSTPGDAGAREGGEDRRPQQRDNDREGNRFDEGGGNRRRRGRDRNRNRNDRDRRGGQPGRDTEPEISEDDVLAILEK